MTAGNGEDDGGGGWDLVLRASSPSPFNHAVGSARPSLGEFWDSPFSVTLQFPHDIVMSQNAKQPLMVVLGGAVTPAASCLLRRCRV